MRILFIRHGEPDYVRDCLTETGKRQAGLTALRLADEEISSIFSSPNGRAQLTAAPTAAHFGLEVQVLPFMHEINWGSPEGDAEVREGHPWTLGLRMMREGCGPDPESWKHHPYFAQNKCLDYHALIAGEIDRWLEGFGYVREGGCYRCTRDNDTTVALFAHGGSGACVFSHFLNLSFAYTCAILPYGLCSVSEFSLPAKAGEVAPVILSLFNDQRHLREAESGPMFFGR